MASGAPISFANIAQKDQRKLPLRSVQLEGQVLLKIAQHCSTSSSLNTVLTGQLLGLDVGQTLEVTDCFPFPVSLHIINKRFVFWLNFQSFDLQAFQGNLYSSN